MQIAPVSPTGAILEQSNLTLLWQKRVFFFAHLKSVHSQNFRMTAEFNENYSATTNLLLYKDDECHLGYVGVMKMPTGYGRVRIMKELNAVRQFVSSGLKVDPREQSGDR